jgi:hypothetical protein
MKNFIEIINNEIIDFINENYNDEYDYYSLYDDKFREILYNMLKKSTKKIILDKINPIPYQKALDEFMKFGQFIHYPTKYVYDWKDIIIENTVWLNVLSMFWGHTSYFNIEDFNDTVFGDESTENYVHDWNQAMKYIENNGYDDVLENILPKFSNGHYLISDYGLEPLQKICMKLLNTNDPNKIIVLINMALDVSHQRSDLSELFIEGGASSLDRISNT